METIEIKKAILLFLLLVERANQFENAAIKRSFIRENLSEVFCNLTDPASFHVLLDFNSHTKTVLENPSPSNLEQITNFPLCVPLGSIYSCLLASLSKKCPAESSPLLFEKFVSLFVYWPPLSQADLTTKTTCSDLEIILHEVERYEEELFDAANILFDKVDKA